MARPQRTQTYSKLLKEISPMALSGHSKVTVVGAGQVGMAATFSLLSMGICSDLSLVDVRKDAALGEQMDLVHGQAFLGRRCNIQGDSDYAISKGGLEQFERLFTMSDVTRYEMLFTRTVWYIVKTFGKKYSRNLARGVGRKSGG